MNPDARQHKSDPYYIRELMFVVRDQLRITNWHELAEVLGVCKRKIFRMVNLRDSKTDYPTQFLAESMIPEEELKKIRKL